MYPFLAEDYWSKRVILLLNPNSPHLGTLKRSLFEIGFSMGRKTTEIVKKIQ